MAPALPLAVVGFVLSAGLVDDFDPKAAQCETELLSAVNRLRAEKKLEPLAMDETLRRLARQMALAAAEGKPEARDADSLIKARNVGGQGYRFQHVFGAKAAEIVRKLRADKSMAAALLGPYQRAGLGAVWVEAAKPPSFQAFVLVVADPDPMAGRPGLSLAQTDPVMRAANAEIKKCYDAALKIDPNLGGETAFQIVIDAEGTVDSATVAKSLGSPSFDGCALAVMQALRFPKPYKGKPVTLNHPMRLSPPQGARKVGRLSPVQVSTAFGQAKDDLKACYDAQVEAHPTLAGTITLRVTVAPDGKVINVAITGDELGEPALAQCVIKRVKKLRFAPPDFGGEAEVTYPLKFFPPKPKTD